MTRFMYFIGRAMVRLRWVVLLVWVVAAALIVSVALGIGDNTTNDLTLPGTGSQAAFDLLQDKFPPQQNGTSPIIFSIESGKLTDEPYKSAIIAAYHAVKADPRVNTIYNPIEEHAGALRGDDDRIVQMPVLLNVNPGAVTQEMAEHIVGLARVPAEKANIKVTAGGGLASAIDTTESHESEAIGLLTAALILAFVFGSLVAMGVPILVALFSLGIGLSAVVLLGEVYSIPTVAPTLATMIGLGVGIDYALFMVTRHKEFHADGRDYKEAAARATATSGAAIVFAGGTVVIAVASLAFAGIPIVTALGYSSALVVAVCVLAAVTLLPAVLAIVGNGIDHLRLPKFLRSKDTDPSKGIWAKWAHVVVTHPLMAILAASAVLIPLMIPLFSLQLGIPDNAVEPPDTQERQSYDLMTKGFGVGSNGPFLIAISLPTPAQPSDEYTSKKARAIGLKHELKNEQKAGKKEQKRLTREGNELEGEKNQLETEAAPLVARAEALARKAQALEARGTALAAKGARLQAAATRLEGQLQSIGQTAEKVFRKLIHTSDPDKQARLEARLRTLEQRAVGIVKHLERLKNEGERLEREKTRLEREAAHLAVEAKRLERQGIPIARQALRLEKRGKNFERKVDRAKASKPRKKAHAKDQLARAKTLKHELTHILVKAGGEKRATDPRLVQLQDALTNAPGVDYVSPPQVSDGGTAAVMSLDPTTAPAALETEALVRRMREKDIPAAIAGTGLHVEVGGETASYVDLADLITAKLPTIIGIVIALAFILLLLAFRSIAIPLSAGVMNLVSVAASYGILVAIFQWGWGLSLLGYGYVDSVPIASYVPLMMFAVLFGLSMDYEVFLMSQITEHHNEGESDHDAIVSGLSRSAKVITSAALIMVSVFAAFILYPNPTVKQFGVGLSVAVAIDATIVRILLVPATMTLMGRFVWWFPKWLAKILPDLNIEGAGYFQWLEEHPRQRKAKKKDHSFLSRR